MNRSAKQLPGLAILSLTLAFAGCGQQPPPATPQGTDNPPASAPAPAAPAPPAQPDERADAAPASPPPPPPERPRSTPPRVEPPPPRAKAATHAQPVETSAPEPSTVVSTPPAPPAPAPVPAPIVKTLPAGTPVDVIFLDGVSSETSHIGDPFSARVAQDIRLDGMIVVPAGSIVRGTVGDVTPMKKIGGTAKVVLSFSKLELPDGSSFEIAAGTTQEGKSQTKKDAATIGGAAAGGAVLGKLIGKGSKEALIGAVVGAGVGTAVAAKNKGEEVAIPVGTQLIVELTRAVDITFRP